MSIEVSGGSGGIEVGLVDLEAAAALLATWADEVRRVLGEALAAGVDPDLLASAPLSPVTAMRAEADLARAAGPLGLGGDAAGLLALAAATRSAVLVYRRGELAVAAAVEAGQDAAMLLVGRQAVPLALLGVALRLSGVEVADVADNAFFDAPWLADLAGGAEGLVAGLTLGPLPAPLLAAAVLGGTGPGASGSGEPGPPTASPLPATYEKALGVLAAAGWRLGLLHDGSAVRVVREAVPRAGSHAPTDLASLVSDLDNLADAEHYPSRVRVVEVPQEDGSAVWVVELPGTQEWSPRAGQNPFDVTTDVHQMAQHVTSAAVGVERALTAARIEAGNRTGRDTSHEPVLIAGHSLGGIVAAGLAADRGFRQRQQVTHVVTFGAPIARIPLPDSVSVLSIEHRQDPVPRLEGERNRPARTWVTVTRDLAGDPVAAGRASAAHRPDLYGVSAAEADVSGAPSLEDWRRESAPFFASAVATQPTIRDYRIERVQPAAPD